MKKILAALAVLSTLALAGCGDSTLMEKQYLDDFTKGGVACFEGYTFAVVRGTHSCGITQIWEDGPNGPRPMICGQRGRVQD